jgi:deoxyribonuclease I
MGKNKRKLNNQSENNLSNNQLKKQLAFLRENTRKIHDNQSLYYHEKQDQIDAEEYYRPVSNENGSGRELFFAYHELLNKTHKNQITYFISKDLYLYTWVDLYPDGTVKSIYSGEKKNPESLIIYDYEIINQRYERFKNFLQKIKNNEFEPLKILKTIEWELKVNTEHIVPQSWFGGSEPMKGDLHHLFVCDPNCNIIRSNFPYEDFSFYVPESPNEVINNHCGLAFNNRFEPEFGKGAAARAMLYFLVRYPRAIKKSFRIQMDLSTLIRWHREFSVTLFEKHRNQAIFHIQGNRNPFIDFPGLVDQLDFL